MITIPEVAGQDFLVVCLEDEYSFGPSLALALEKILPRSGRDFFHMLHGVRNVSRLRMNETYYQPSIPAEFENIPKRSQHSRRSSALFRRCALDQLGCLVPYECAEIHVFTVFSRASVTFFCLRNGPPLKYQYSMRPFCVLVSCTWEVDSEMTQTVGCGSSSTRFG